MGKENGGGRASEAARGKVTQGKSLLNSQQLEHTSRETGGKNMKKRYEKPTVEVVKFQYRDQVVVASGISGTCNYYFDGKEPHAYECFKHWKTPGFNL